MAFMLLPCIHVKKVTLATSLHTSPPFSLLTFSFSKRLSHVLDADYEFFPLHVCLAFCLILPLI